MLNKVLDEISGSKGTINLNDLSHKLQIEHSALQGMIAYWVKKG
jgi:hypothetical protein